MQLNINANVRKSEKSAVTDNNIAKVQVKQ